MVMIILITYDGSDAGDENDDSYDDVEKIMTVSYQ